MNDPPGRPSSGERRREPCDGAQRSVAESPHAAIRWTGGGVPGLGAGARPWLVVGLALAVPAAALFALLAGAVASGATQAFDAAAVEWVRARTARWLDGLALAGAALGSEVATWAVLLVGSAVLWRARRRLYVLLLWIALPGGVLLNAELKALFDRPRPVPIGWNLEILGFPVHFPASPSFPSGHAIASVTVFGTLAYLVLRLDPRARVRRLAVAAAAGLILLIGMSRVYLGVHYPSDVLAGYLAGFVWAVLAALVVEAIRHFAARRPG